MSQNNCGCERESVKVPVLGLELALDKEVLGGIGGGTGAGIDYSLEEQWTGKRWVDGKKIYQKTVNLGGLPSNSSKTVAHNITNCESVLEFYGCVRCSSSDLI